MAENVQITPGTGVTIGADSVTDGTLGSAQIQYIKIMDGTIGGTNKAAVTANGLAIDGSGVTQPISAISLPLPTGAATSSNQSSEISLLTTIASNTTNASTPTVSGTVTVLQPTAANLNATVTQTTAADLVTESWLNDGSGNAISSTSGSLDVQVSNFPATQTVAGTVIANAGTGTFQTNVTNASIPVTESGIWNITNITGSISLPTGAATEATLLDVKSDLDQFTFSANGLLVDGSGVTQPVSGTITAQQSVAANLLATVYLNDGSGNPISSTTGSLNVNVTNASGLDTVNQGNPNTLANAWPVELSDGTNLLGTGAHPVRIDPTGTTTQPISGTVSVSNFPATQPVSGTVTANQGTSPWVISGTVTVGNASVAVTQSGVWSIGRTWTLASGTDSVSSVQSGTWNLNNISGTISLPTGAATSAKQPALGTAGSASTDVITVQGIVGMTALKVDGSGVTQPISGTVTANAGTGTFTVGQTTGTNLHTVVDSGSIAVTQSTSPWVVSLASTTITGTVTAVGNLTHNNAAPATNNIGVLPAVASSSTPTYNAGDQVLLSTDLSGNLRVIIDGTVSEQNVNLNQVGGSSISIGQATMAASLPVVLASNQSSIPVTLTSTTITGTVAVTQSTSPWVISGTVTSNVGTTGGLALNTTLINGTQETQIVDGSANVIGPVQTISGTNYLPVVLAASGSTGSVIPSRTVQIGGSDGTDLRTFKVSATGVLSVDGSAVTQPISGTVTSNQGTAAALAGAWPVEITDGTNVLGTSSHPVRIDPTGTTTQPVSLISTTITGTVAVTQSGTWTVQPGNTANTTPWLSTISQGGNSATVTVSNALKVDGSAVTQPVSGTITANQGGAPWSQNITQIGGSTIVTGGTSGLLAIAGPVASGTANADNPVKVGAVFNTTQPTVTNGEVVDSQATARGAQIVATGVDTFDVTVNTALPAGSNTIGAVTQASGPWTSNITQVGGVAVAATAKATQASDFIPVQQPKDSGRDYITFTADAIAGVTSETLITFTLNKQGTTTASQTNYTPPNGKTLRIQALMIDVQSGAGAGGWVRVKLRHNTAGATTTSSALVFTAGSGTTNATAIASGIPVPIPDGLEIFGDGTQTIGITHLSSAITTVESITLVGYEY